MSSATSASRPMKKRVTVPIATIHGRASSARFWYSGKVRAIR